MQGHPTMRPMVGWLGGWLKVAATEEGGHLIVDTDEVFTDPSGDTWTPAQAQ